MNSTLRRRGVIVTLCLLAITAGSGCGIIRKALNIDTTPMPPREFYRLSFPDSLTAAASVVVAKAPLHGSIGVEPYISPGLYGQSPIVFRINENQYGSYPDREWAIPLGQMLGLFTTNALHRWPLSAEPALFDPPTRRAQSYLWRATVREFDEVDRDPDVFAAVRIDASVVRADDDSVLWSDSYRVERRVPIAAGTERNAQMSAIVGTLSELATESVETLVTRALEHVSGHPAAAAQRPR